MALAPLFLLFHFFPLYLVIYITTFFWGAFGVQVSYYFRLQDYLASSLEGISYSLSAAILGIVSFFVGFHSSSRKSKLQIEYEMGHMEYWQYFIFMIAILGALMAYLQDTEVFYDCIYVIALFITMKVSQNIACKYFKEQRTAIFILVFIGMFSAHMYSSLSRKIYELKHYEISKKQAYNLIFKNDLQINGNELMLIAGNSDYFFFIDKQRNPIIIPKEKVLYLSRNIKMGDDKMAGNLRDWLKQVFRFNSMGNH